MHSSRESPRRRKGLVTVTLSIAFVFTGSASEVGRGTRGGLEVVMSIEINYTKLLPQGRELQLRRQEQCSTHLVIILLQVSGQAQRFVADGYSDTDG